MFKLGRLVFVVFLFVVFFVGFSRNVDAVCDPCCDETNKDCMRDCCCGTAGIYTCYGKWYCGDSCGDKECGIGCDGEDCGSCASGYECDDGECVISCVPDPWQDTSTYRCFFLTRQIQQTREEACGGATERWVSRPCSSDQHCDNGECVLNSFCGDGSIDTGEECDTSLTGCGNFASACSSCSCVYSSASISNIDVTTPCIGNLANSRKFTVSGQSEYCGDINITVDYGDSKEEFLITGTDNYAFSHEFIIPSEKILPLSSPITINIKGNRNILKDSKDEGTYTCLEQRTLNIKYLNFYYCPEPDVEYDFDYYDLPSYYQFYGETTTREWDECNSDAQLTQCVSEITSCVGSDSTYSTVNQVKDGDNDNEYEICYAVDNIQGGWIDADSSQEFCELVDNMRIATWFDCSNPNQCAEGIDDFAPDNPGLCCGDDPDEIHLKTKSKLGDNYLTNNDATDLIFDSCCDISQTCVDEEGNCRNEDYSYCILQGELLATCTQGEWILEQDASCAISECSNNRLDDIEQCDEVDETYVYNCISDVCIGNVAKKRSDSCESCLCSYETTCDSELCGGCEIDDDCPGQVCDTNTCGCVDYIPGRELSVHIYNEDCVYKFCTSAPNDKIYNITGIITTSTNFTSLSSEYFEYWDSLELESETQISFFSIVSGDQDCILFESDGIITTNFIMEDSENLSRIYFEPSDSHPSTMPFEFSTPLSNSCRELYDLCIPGTTLCEDWTCSQDCDETDGGEIGCIGLPNNVCEIGEGCACNDCENKKSVCTTGAVCGGDGVCGCDVGKTLCNDMTCDETCEDNDGKKGCDGLPDKICEFGEGCACIDCAFNQDSCAEGTVCNLDSEVCEESSSAECRLGETLCNDFTCDETCEDNGGKRGCDGPANGICEDTEGCACKDCDGQRDSCANGLYCDIVEQVCIINIEEEEYKEEICEDKDRDGFFEKSATCTGSNDCDDRSRGINPGVTEICNNNIDENCNGLIDERCDSNFNLVIQSNENIQIFDMFEIKVIVKNHLQQEIDNLEISIDLPAGFSTKKKTNIHNNILSGSSQLSNFVLFAKDVSFEEPYIDIITKMSGIESVERIPLNIKVPEFLIAADPEQIYNKNKCVDLYYVIDRNFKDPVDIELNVMNPNAFLSKTVIVDYISSINAKKRIIQPFLANPYCAKNFNKFEIIGYLYQMTPGIFVDIVKESKQSFSQYSESQTVLVLNVNKV